MQFIDFVYILIWVSIIGVFVSFFKSEYDMLQIFWICTTVLAGYWTLVYFGDHILSVGGILSAAIVVFMAVFFVKKLDYCCDCSCYVEGG